MLYFIYHIAYGGEKVAEFNQHSKQMLDELEKEYPVAFSESGCTLYGSIDSYFRYL